MAVKSIKSGSAVFAFVDGVTVDTFEKDEDFRSGTITGVVVGKARIQWDLPRFGGVVAKDGNAYEYVDMSRLTRVDAFTYILDDSRESSEKSVSA